MKEIIPNVYSLKQAKRKTFIFKHEQIKDRKVRLDTMRMSFTFMS